jgi:hypothetical protein
MTTRKPKLNLLYVTETSTPWLQLAVVTTDQSLQHARQWQGARFAATVPAVTPAAPSTTPRKH